MGSELLRIWERGRKTILFVTHDIDEAIYLADRIIVMSARRAGSSRTSRVTLPRPRPLDIRNDPTFTAYRQRIWDLLEREQVLALEFLGAAAAGRGSEMRAPDMSVAAQGTPRRGRDLGERSRATARPARWSAPRGRAVPDRVADRRRQRDHPLRSHLLSDPRSRRRSRR